MHRNKAIFVAAACWLLFITGVAGAAPKADLWSRWQAHDAGSRIAVDHSAWDRLLSRYLVIDHPSGVNLVRCHNQEQLDQARAAGLLGWLPLAVHQGPTDRLKATVNAVKDHPALAVWEGPDEVVWNFTAWSGLKAKAGFTREDWQRQPGKRFPGESSNCLG